MKINLYSSSRPDFWYARASGTFPFRKPSLAFEIWYRTLCPFTLSILSPHSLALAPPSLPTEYVRMVWPKLIRKRVMWTLRRLISYPFLPFYRVLSFSTAFYGYKASKKAFFSLLISVPRAVGPLAPRLSVTTSSSADLRALSPRITMETVIPSYNGLIPLNRTDENLILSF